MSKIIAPDGATEQGKEKPAAPDAQSMFDQGVSEGAQRFERRLSEALKRVYNEVDVKPFVTLEIALDELQDLRLRVKQAGAPEEKNEAYESEIKALRTTLEATNEKHQKQIIGDRVKAMAGTLKAKNPKQVTTLFEEENKLVLNEVTDQVEVYFQNGLPRISEQTGARMSLREGMTAFREAYPHLFDTSEGGDSATVSSVAMDSPHRVWKRSEVVRISKDPRLYAQHRDAILAAERDGRIEND